MLMTPTLEACGIEKTRPATAAGVEARLSAGPQAAQGAARQDEIASAPMLAVGRPDRQHGRGRTFVLSGCALCGLGAGRQPGLHSGRRRRAGLLDAARLQGRRHQHRGRVPGRDRLHDRALDDLGDHRLGLHLMGGVGQVNLGGWDRRRLLVILGCVVATAMLLLLGLGYAAYFAVTSATGTAKPVPATAAAHDAPGPQAAQGAARQDEIASAPMLAVGPADSRASTPAAVAGRVFSMPHASKVGVISIVVVFLAAIGYM